MIVGLIQVALAPDSFALNLQTILAAIDRAAGATPSPDLLVLPARCDTGGVAPKRDFPIAIAEGTREAICERSREWGIHIAAGMHMVEGGELTPITLLIDPDGDAVARTGKPTDHNPAGSDSGSLVDCCDGKVVMMCGSPLEAASAVENLDCCGALAILPVCHEWHRCSKNGSMKTAMVELASRKGVHIAIASPASLKSSDVDIASFLCAPDGQMLAFADGSRAETLFADVQLAPATSEHDPAQDDDSA